MVNLQNNKINYTKNRYLSNLDLINKLNLNDKRKIPFLNQIVLELPCVYFANNFVNSRHEFDLEVQIKGMLVLYLLAFNLPFINYKKIKIFDKSFVTKSENIRHFSLKITLNDKSFIDKFLIKIFIEQMGVMNVDLQQSKKKDLVFDKYSLKYKKFNYINFIPISKILELDFFLNRVLSDINSQELFLKLNLEFYECFVKMNFKNLIKNLPFFWINGRVV